MPIVEDSDRTHPLTRPFSEVQAKPGSQIRSPNAPEIGDKNSDSENKPTKPTMEALIHGALEDYDSGWYSSEEELPDDSSEINSENSLSQPLDVVNTFHGSIEDLLEDPENQEMVQVCGKLMLLPINELHSMVTHGRPVTEAYREQWRAQYVWAKNVQKCGILEMSVPAVMSIIEDLVPVTFLGMILKALIFPTSTHSLSVCQFQKFMSNTL